MPVKLYMDVHVDGAITEQLRLRGVDVLTAQEDGCALLEDEDLLERAKALGRVMFTQDIRFWSMAGQWQAAGRLFAGLLFGHQRKGVGVFVKDLEIVAKATDPDYWENVVEYLPL